MTASIAPRFCPYGSIMGTRNKIRRGSEKPWQLWIPTSMSSTEMCSGSSLKPKGQPRAAADVLQTARNFGRTLLDLSSARRAIAAKAFQLIGERSDVALLELIRIGLAAEQRATRAYPGSKIIDEFIVTKQAQNSKHCYNLCYTRKGSRFWMRGRFPK